MNTKIVSALVAAFIGAGSLFAGGEGWTHDLPAAKATAAKDKKDLLLDFTGSDWCPPCKMLDEEVFSKDAFKNVVPNDFVLVQFDFPKQTPQAPELAEANKKIAEEYAIEGYPTVILADAAGRPYASIGYEEGGAEKYVAQLAVLRETKKGRDEAFAKAAKAEGLEKAKLLAEGLAKIAPGLQATFYKDEVAAIIAADKDDSLGFGKKAKLAEQEKAFEAEVEALRPEIMAAMEKKDTDTAIKLVDGLIAKGNYQGEMKQRAMTLKIGFFAMRQDHAGALKFVDEIIAIDEKSEIASQLKDIRPRIEAAVKAAAAQPAPALTPEAAPAPAPEAPAAK